MIQINLLPVREARRKADLRQQLMQLVLVFIVVGGGIGVTHARLVDRIETARARVQQMEADIDRFKPQLDQVAVFRQKKAALEKKIEIIEGLDRARVGPVRMLDELAVHTPERLWLSNISTKGNAIALDGQSLDNELVAIFLGALGDSPYFKNVDLNGTELSIGSDGLKVVKFKIEASMATPPKTES